MHFHFRELKCAFELIGSLATMIIVYARKGSWLQKCRIFWVKRQKCLGLLFSSRGHRKTLTSFGYRMHFIESEMYLSIRYLFADS